MSVEVQWTDTDPATGEKRFVTADRFARAWRFRVRARRREAWQAVTPSRDMVETLLEALERRLPRREGVTEADIRTVRAMLPRGDVEPGT
jgi:hypothetical protein